MLPEASKQLQHLSSPTPSHCPTGDLGVLRHRATGPSPSMVLIPRSGIPLPPGNFGVGGGVTGLGVFPALPKLFLGRIWRQDPSPPWQPDLGVTPYLLPGVLNWQWDAPSLHTSLSAFHFPRDSRTNLGDSAQAHSGVPQALSSTAWRSGRAGESHAGRTQWELFEPGLLLGKPSSLSPAPGSQRQAGGGRVSAALSPQPLCL